MKNIEQIVSKIQRKACQLTQAEEKYAEDNTSFRHNNILTIQRELHALADQLRRATEDRKGDTIEERADDYIVKSTCEDYDDRRMGYIDGATEQKGIDTKRAQNWCCMNCEAQSTTDCPTMANCPTIRGITQAIGE